MLCLAHTAFTVLAPPASLNAPMICSSLNRLLFIWFCLSIGAELHFSSVLFFGVRPLESHSAAPATIRRKLSALASLFDHLCEANSVTYNPLRGVKRPKADANEGKTLAIGDGQAKSSEKLCKVFRW